MSLLERGDQGVAQQELWPYSPRWRRWSSLCRAGACSCTAADRHTDYGTTYDAWGNITKLPAIDAGGNELTNTYYTSNKFATQSQQGETITYNQDPSLRTREIVSTGTTSSDVINHFAGNGDSPAWTVETPSGH